MLLFYRYNIIFIFYIIHNVGGIYDISGLSIYHSHNTIRYSTIVIIIVLYINVCLIHKIYSTHIITLITILFQRVPHP